MPEENNSHQIARFHIALHDAQKVINDILTLGEQLQCPDDELLQILDLAAMNIESYLKAYRLEAVPIRKGGDAMS